MAHKTISSLDGLVIGLVAALVAGMLWGVAATERRVEQAVRQNVSAAALLSRLQVEGEKLRRYEKEMFIYVAVPDRRAGYVKEFETAYGRLLELTNDMLAPSSATFSDEERAEILKWKQAAVFYAGEFANLGRRALATNLATLTVEQRLGLTVSYNDDIKAGKDRFRELLTGTEKMRLEKEARTQRLAEEMARIFTQLRTGVLVGGLLVLAGILAPMRAQLFRRFGLHQAKAPSLH